MNSMYHTLIALKNAGHKVNVVLIEYDEKCKKEILNNIEIDTNETKISFGITDKIEVLKKMDAEKIRIFDLVEFDKKKLRSVFHHKSVNVVLGKPEKITPMYIGLFPNLPTITDILNTEKLNDRVTQQTPLHVTLEYLGGKTDDNKTDNKTDDNKTDEESHKYLEYPFGKTYEIDVIGYSDNKAGLCLVAKLPDDLNVQNPSVPHITLATNKEFTPADVGKKIDETNIKKFEKPYTIKCVLAAMF